MQFDDLLVRVGDLGLYQKRIIFCLFLSVIPTGMHMVNVIFIAAVPKHRCAIPGLYNDTYGIQNELHQFYINSTIPMDDRDPTQYSQCSLHNTTDETHVIGNHSVYSCSQWVYDTSIFAATVVTKFNLVCYRNILNTHAQSACMAGVLVGALIMGTLSDTFGRKKIYILTILLQVASGGLTPWAPEYFSYISLRIIMGISLGGTYLIVFVYCLELVTPSKRTWFGVIINICYAIGLLTLVFLAYFIRHWETFQFVISIPGAVFLLNYWIIPESPRWLHAKHRNRDAMKIMMKAAKVNGVDLSPDDVLKPGCVGNVVTKEEKLWVIFSSRTMAVRSAITFLLWCVVSMVYFGLSLNIGNMSGDVYLNFFLVSIIEVPAYVACLLLLDRLGRKPILVVSMIIGGVACISTIFPMLFAGPGFQLIILPLIVLGKLGASASFAIIFIFSSELFPTVVRNGAVGMASMHARIGAVLAPYIADLGIQVGGDFGKALPLIVFGCLTVVAGLLSLYLPETLGEILPDTIEESEQFGRKRRSDITESNGHCSVMDWDRKL